ncbi:MAG TPA: hypothetical protein VEJ16_15670 [Alphaproteobacteria bacterium]|nr:hypothetical protein [Alphaproteobacteria bacterium]
MDTISQFASTAGGGIVALAFVVVVFILAVLWFCLPFAVFGVKPLLREVLEQQRQTNEYLRKLTTPKTDEQQEVPRLGRPERDSREVRF